MCVLLLLVVSEDVYKANRAQGARRAGFDQPDLTSKCRRRQQENNERVSPMSSALWPNMVKICVVRRQPRRGQHSMSADCDPSLGLGQTLTAIHLATTTNVEKVAYTRSISEWGFVARENCRKGRSGLAYGDFVVLKWMCREGLYIILLSSLLHAVALSIFFSGQLTLSTNRCQPSMICLHFAYSLDVAVCLRYCI